MFVFSCKYSNSVTAENKHKHVKLILAKYTPQNIFSVDETVALQCSAYQNSGHYRRNILWIG
jgi:hypothetical protein